MLHPETAEFWTYVYPLLAWMKVARAREAVQTGPSPEQHLEKAVAARSSAMRAKHARLGLSARPPLDRTTQAMLLRQLYLAHFEARRFAQAGEVAEQMIALKVLPDVAHQDAARACQALGKWEDALGHLRLAARKSPASRRAFHLWTLGGVLYLNRRYGEAASALTRAARWGTTDKPLYIGHMTLARCAMGEPAPDLGPIIDQLTGAPCGQGYGRFVLGRLCCYAGRRDDAVRHLEAFVRRTTSGRLALSIALEGELSEARAALAQMRKN
jgi:tetratricopeptide (TPR) repeat protein